MHMIKFIIGLKGSGKTKTMIDMANEAVKQSKGNVVCVEKGLQLTYNLSHRIRLVDVDQYNISGCDAYFGFLCGLMAGNYDITDIFCDATLRICEATMEQVADMMERLLRITTANGLCIVFTLSCELEELPERIRGYVI
jgi:hypothetical protein